MNIKEKMNLLFKHYNFLNIEEDYILTKDKLINITTDEEVKFDSLQDLLNYKLKEKTLEKYIDELEIIYQGGRGASSSSRSSSANIWEGTSEGKGGHNTVSRLSAEFNVDRRGSYEGATKKFAEKYKNAKVEYGIEVDSNGYVYQHKKGGKGAVRISSNNRENIIVHNHPNNSILSKSDLLATASNKRTKGVYAVGSTNTYKFEKRNRFKAEDFAKALPKATAPKRLKGEARIDYWLKKNQDKYGYTYRKEKT